MEFWKRKTKIFGTSLFFLCALTAHASLGSPLEKNASPAEIFRLSMEEDLDARIKKQGQVQYDSKIFDLTQYPENSLVRRHSEFWVKIYSDLTTKQGFVHDTKYVEVIYERLNMDGYSRAERRRMVRASKRKWKAVLRSVHQKRDDPTKMSDEEKQVFQLFAHIDEPNKFLNATRKKRIRFQLGQRDRFEGALVNSGEFLPMMEKIFIASGVPWELTRLPFVESSFNVNARSKVGASGMWQFIRSTGRLYLKINEVIDERNDPYRATDAAASLLRTNFEALKAWPPAIIAYNHGRKGMMKAVRQVGTDDVEKIIEQYRGRRFGFASRNFFMELLAAIHVERNAATFFKELERKKPQRFVEVGVADFISARDLTRFLKIDYGKFKYLNPGLTNDVFRGRKHIPVGYRLRIPSDWAIDTGDPRKAFWTGYLKIPDRYKHPRQRGERAGRDISSN